MKTLFGGAAAFPAVKAIETLKLETNDVLVLTVDIHISDQTAEAIRQQMEEKFPGHKCLVLGPEVSLKVMKG